MHCGPQAECNDSPKVSEAEKNSTSTTNQQQNKVTSLDITKHCQESSLSRTDSDSRYAILSFLNVEPDGSWKILAVPVQCLNHVNLASGITMDGLQLLFPPPLNRPKIDQCKAPRGQVPQSAYSAKSYARRSFTNSNVRRRCQNKLANKACILNKLPVNSCTQSSVITSSSPSLCPDSSATVISSDKCMSDTKEEKSLTKNLRKRMRKKLKQNKKLSSESGSNDRESHNEEFGCVSLTSETCSSNDVETAAPDFLSSDNRLMKIDCERKEIDDKTSVTDELTRRDSHIDEAVMSKAESRNQLHDRDSLVLDAVSIGSKCDVSVNGSDIEKPSKIASCGIALNSGDEYFLGHGLTNSYHNNCEHNEEMRNNVQNCVGNDKRVQQKRTMSKSSSSTKFAGVGVPHGRLGKENSHSVWQKVRKNSLSECASDDLKKVNTASSQFISATENDPSAIKNCNSVSGPEDKKQIKNKAGRKSKGKVDSVSKKGQSNYSRKGSNVNRTVLNDNMKVSIQQNNFSNISSQEMNQQGLVMEFQTNGILQETSAIVHSEQFHPEESDIQKSSLETKNEIINQSDLSDTQSQVSCNLVDNQVGQTIKEFYSSADYNAQKWKWIPKKDTRLTKSESNSSLSEYSYEPKTDSLSHTQDSLPKEITTGMDQIESENHKLSEEVAGKLIEHMGKHEVANHVIYECENQDMFENDLYRIAQAVNNACRVQLACEVVQKAIGGPVAEFERLLHFCSPVICRSPDSLGCFTCGQNHSIGVSLCRHKIPEVSLGCLWEWYEKHGSYGLEIKAWDYENPKTVPFRAYFVPSLSAVQLFKNHKSFRNCKISEAGEMIDYSEDSFTVPINDALNQCTNSTFSSDLELLFEYFECEQPQQRRPLYERILELVRGDVPIQSKTYGDATKLDSINLRDLHPRSWYSVAWYPIYRIPDGNFRASFLTYHSLGHLVHRSSNSDPPTLDSCIVSPAVGLQSYNAQSECWFRLSQSALTAEMLGINPSIFLKERLRTLEETASVMARAVVHKGNKICTNRHPDYEFFLSRRRY